MSGSLASTASTQVTFKCMISASLSMLLLRSVLLCSEITKMFEATPRVRNDPGFAGDSRGGVERCSVMTKSAAARSLICAAQEMRRRIANPQDRRRVEHSLVPLSCVLCPVSCVLCPGIKPGFRSSTSRRPPSDQMAYAPPDHPPLQYETRPVNFRDSVEGDEYPHSTLGPEVATTFTGYTSGITIPYSG